MIGVLSFVASSSTGLVVTPAVMPQSAVMPRVSGVDMKVISKKPTWVTFATTAECTPDSIISGFRYGQEIAICTEKSGKLYAMSNKLPPTSQPVTLSTLSNEGTLFEPISGTEFSLKTGQPVGIWCPSVLGQLILKRLSPPQPALTFPVRKQGKSVQVLIDVNAKAAFEANYWRGVLDSQGKVDGGYY